LATGRVAAMPKLYYTATSCGAASFIVAHALGLGLPCETVDLGTHRTASGADFLAVNPKGNVPALVLHDGTLLNEGAAVLQWLADQARCRKLCGAVSVRRGGHPGLPAAAAARGAAAARHKGLFRRGAGAARHAERCGGVHCLWRGMSRVRGLGAARPHPRAPCDQPAPRAARMHRAAPRDALR
jgi:glutathione S-transferase